jgi:glycosyltransferase involved in cell wall biosynthesis
VSDDGEWPDVAVVVPVRNEAGSLEAAVAAITAQQYPGLLEVCLAVAPSNDGTEVVAGRLAAADRRITVAANPAGSTPAGLNAAIRATSAPVIARVDGHAELAPGYIRRAVETMRRTGAVNVGGIQRAVGLTPLQRATAAAMSSRFGAGDAKFHYGGSEGPTDTVYLGVYDRAAIVAAGLFDERLARNQDYELNIRLRAAGGTVWFDPRLSVVYRPRSSLGALARQYFEYGRGKRKVLALHPGSLRWRQAAPPIAVAGVVGGLILGRWWRPARAVPAAYAAAVVLASFRTGRRHGVAPHRLVAVFPAMHLSWGLGFLTAGDRVR